MTLLLQDPWEFLLSAPGMILTAVSLMLLIMFLRSWWKDEYDKSDSNFSNLISFSRFGCFTWIILGLAVLAIL